MRQAGGFPQPLGQHFEAAAAAGVRVGLWADGGGGGGPRCSVSPEQVASPHGAALCFVRKGNEAGPCRGASHLLHQGWDLGGGLVKALMPSTV